MESIKTNNVLITGGTGLVGQYLTGLLQKKGYTVCYLSRQKNKNNAIQHYHWDINKGELDEIAIRNADFVVHLAGANVGEQRWREKRKQEILESRTLSTELLADALESIPHQIKAFVGASAIGIYGNTHDTLVDENTAFGNDFLAKVCIEWEKQLSLIADTGVRIVVLRIGVVLASTDGALPKMANPIRYGVGAPLASGNQWISWIHLHDLCNMIIFALENPTVSGIYNAVTNYATNREFTQQIARKLHRPLWLPNVPEVVLKLLLGEMHQIVTTSCKVSNQKIRNTGFEFVFDTLPKALDDLL